MKLDENTWSKQIVPIKGPEDLREITRGSDVEVTQLQPGRLRGSIRHIGIGDLGISVGNFSTQIRSKGPLHRSRFSMTLTAIGARSCASQPWLSVLSPSPRFLRFQFENRLQRAESC